ncbi:hypothetical protein [Haliovirga abyssi]|uniref:Uncharacterized protein n=1 Tax=Haliovirga abyssi TaxID=2996794 RepID=A0AAU9DIT1_9FUSO|nr:hypothetical protein [Haliovirga abyssi]BDU49707.1 hypothetical protein HLVA_02760 [Haliovirga abyssi]
MKNINEFITQHNNYITSENLDINIHRTAITILSHERLIHLIIMLFTILFTFIFLALSLILNFISLYIIFLIFLLLSIAYIAYYFKLENTTQNWEIILYKKINSASSGRT